MPSHLPLTSYLPPAGLPALPESRRCSAHWRSALHAENVRTSLQLAFFAICLSIAQAVFMVVFRTGLPTPVLSYTIGPAILICTVLGPTLWASRGPGRVKWVHPDCGFWMQKRSVADRKMEALVAGRDKYLGR